MTEKDKIKEEINLNLEEELDKQFPKGDKARGRALVLFAIAQIELDKVKKQATADFIKFLEMLIKVHPNNSGCKPCPVQNEQIENKIDELKKQMLGEK